MTEKILPTRGLVLVKRVEVEDKIRGIIMAPEVVDKWTAQQVEVVAVGKPVLYEEIPDRLLSKKWKAIVRGRRVLYQRKDPAPVKRGDWVLIYPRTLCPTGERDLYMVTFDNVMGKFKT
jgi:co-chaperonin GroES (HSP10)